MTLVKGDILSLQWLARQLGCHGHGWTGPSGTENKMLSQERRRKLPTLPLTSSLLFTVYWGPDWLRTKRLYLFASVDGGQQGRAEKRIQSLSPGCQTQSLIWSMATVTFQNGEGKICLLLETQCASLMLTASLFSSPVSPIRGVHRMLGFQSKRKTFHNKTSLRMPGSLLRGSSAVFFSQRRGLP